MANEEFRVEFVGEDKLSPTINQIKKALQDEATAQRDAIKAQQEATAQAEKLFQTRAKLTQQRVGEALKQEADAAKAKARADKEASDAAEKLFQTNAKLTQQRVKEALQEQATAAKNKAQADRDAATAAAKLVAEQEKFERAFNSAAIAQQVEQTERLRQGYQALAIGAGALTTAVGGIFAKGVGDFTDFERSIKTIGVIGEQVGSKELASLTDEIKRLGIETSKTPQEIAKATIELTKAGFSAEEAKQAIGGIVQGSEATGASLTQVSDTVAKTIRQFGLAASDSQKVSDILVKAANETNVGIDTLSESLKFVGPTAKASNQSLEDTVTLLGLLGDAGLQGGQGGRNLSTALERLKIASAASESGLGNLVRGSKRAAEALNVLGLQVRNSDGSTKSLLGLLPELRKQLETLSKQDQDIVLKSLFGVEGGRAVTALLVQSDERIQKVSESIKSFDGASAKASEQLKKGLSGAFDLLDGSIGSASIKIGEFVSVGLEPLVRSATLLVNTFLQLPGPIQGVIIGITGLTGAIAGAVAIIATYKALQIDVAIANAGLAIQQGIQTAATIAQTLATTAQTVAQGALNLVTKEFTLAQIQQALTTGLAQAKTILLTAATNLQTVAMGALAIATGKADAAQLAQIANLGKLALAAGLTAAAIGSVALAASRFSDGGKEFNESAGKIEKKLLDLELQAGKTKEAVKSTIPDEPPPTDFVDGALNEINKLARERNKFLGLDENFLILSTNAEKQLSDAKLGVDNLRTATTQLAAKAGEVGSGFQKGLKPTEDQVKQAKGVQDALNTAIQETDARLKGLDPNKLGKKAYEELKNQLEATKTELLRTQTAFTQATGSTAGNTAATLADADASGTNADAKKSEADSIKELNKIKADAIKQQQEDQKTADERGFQDSEKAIARDLADQKAAREKKLQSEIAKRQEESEARVAQLQKESQAETDKLKEEGDKKVQESQRKFDKEQGDFKESREGLIQARQREFDKSQADFKLSEESKIAAKKKEFEQAIADFKTGEERKIQDLQKDFEQRQKDDERQFQREQQDKEKAFQSELDGKKNAATKKIDRTLQLEEANPGDRARLTKQFEDEDKKATRRAELEKQILAPIQAQEDAFKKQQQAADDAFKARQEADKQGFQDSTIDPAKRQLDKAVDQKKGAADAVISEEQRALDDALNARKLEFEQGPLKALKDQLETDLEARKLAFETNTLSPLKKQIETEIEAAKTEGENRIKEVKKVAEAEIQALKDAAALVERDKDRQAEDERQKRERDFKDEQRDKDRENAAEIKSILESTTIPGLGQNFGDVAAPETQSTGGQTLGTVADDNITANKDFNGTDGIDPVRPFVTPEEAAVGPIKKKKRRTLADAIARFTGGPVEPGELYLGGERQPEALKFNDGSTQQIGGFGPELFTVDRPGYIYPDWSRYVQAQQAPVVNVAAASNADVVAALKRIEQKAMGNLDIHIHESRNPDLTAYHVQRVIQRVK